MMSAPRKRRLSYMNPTAAHRRRYSFRVGDRVTWEMLGRSFPGRITKVIWGRVWFEWEFAGEHLEWSTRSQNPQLKLAESPVDEPTEG